MLNTETFRLKKHDLVDILNEINAPDIKGEIDTFEFIVEVCENYNNNIKKSLTELTSPLYKVKSVEELNEAVKSLSDDILYWKIAFRHDPAYIVVRNFGADPSYDYSKHLSKFTIEPNIVGKHFLEADVKKRLEAIAYEDGAIILNPKNEVMMVHGHMINLDPPAIIQNMYGDGGVYPDCLPTEPKFYGFKQDINTRHLAGLYSSGIPGVIVYTLGERIEKWVGQEKPKLTIQDGHIRRYEEGLITASTYYKESRAVERSIKILKSRRNLL